MKFNYIIILICLLLTAFVINGLKKAPRPIVNCPFPINPITEIEEIPEIPQSPQKDFTPDIRVGGKDLEGSCRAEAIRQLRGQGPITEGTIVHEATHFLNSILTRKLGGNMYKPSIGYCAFYLWGENRYLVIPTSNTSKSSVIPLIPMDTIGYTFKNYFGNMFAHRDAIHIIEDFNAELNGFEPDSPTLLRDMLIYSVALGLKMQQQNHEKLQEYEAGNKFLIERALKKPIDLRAFKSSNNPKAIALRNYLKTTYGDKWFNLHF